MSSAEEYPAQRSGNNIDSSFFRYRPLFIERDMMVVPSCKNKAERRMYCHSRVEKGGDNGGGAIRRRASSFPINNDAGYIGYITDDGVDGILRLRRELLGSNVSFSTTLFFIALVVLVTLAVGRLLVWRGVVRLETTDLNE